MKRCLSTCPIVFSPFLFQIGGFYLTQYVQINIAGLQRQVVFIELSVARLLNWLESHAGDD